MTWIFAGIGLPKFVTDSISSRTTFVIYSMPSAKSGMYFKVELTVHVCIKLTWSKSVFLINILG